MSILSEQEIAEIERRANAASRGPWMTHSPDNYNNVLGYSEDAKEYLVVAQKCSSWWNMSFIAHARADVPTLIASLREAKAALAKCNPYKWEEIEGDHENIDLTCTICNGEIDWQDSNHADDCAWYLAHKEQEASGE